MAEPTAHWAVVGFECCSQQRHVFLLPLLPGMMAFPSIIAGMTVQSAGTMSLESASNLIEAGKKAVCDKALQHTCKISVHAADGTLIDYGAAILYHAGSGLLLSTKHIFEHPGVAHIEAVLGTTTFPCQVIIRCKYCEGEVARL